MKGIKNSIITAWNLWPDPYLLKDYIRSINVRATDVKTPDGHNCILKIGRDTYFGKPIKVYKDHKYRFEITAKALQGNLPLGCGFLGNGLNGSHSNDLYNLTSFTVRYSLYKDLGDGWGIYRKEINPNWDSDNALLYFQLEQNNDGNTQWLIGNIHVCDLTEMGGAIVKFLCAVILNLAYAGRKEVA